MEDTSFVREKIKQKPINRSRLIRRTLITVLMAAVFGVVACLTFLLLEPIISDTIVGSHTANPTEEVSTVVLPDVVDDEMLPEDMIASDRDVISEALQGDMTQVRGDVRDIEQMIKSISFGIADYQNLYNELRSLAESVSQSIVTVRGVSEGVDMLDNPFEYSAEVSGVVVADNGVALLILVRDVNLSSTDEMHVQFADGTSCNCDILGSDADTGLMILAVAKKDLGENTLSSAVPVSLGSSRSTTLKGTPVLALGSPVGISDSFAYGMVTSGTQQLYMTDSDYTLITTDILGTDASSGVLINLRGSVIGIIDNSYESDSPEGVVNALGISELKSLIEHLSNVSPRPYLGIKGMDISYTMRNDYDLPEGIYIRDVAIDSPAMEAGVQRGDILTAVNGEAIINYHDFILWLSDEQPDTTMALTLLRPSVDEYIQVDCEVTLSTIH